MKTIKSFVVLVHNQQEALDFYTQKLGFDVHTDADFGEGNRWLTIALPGQAQLEIVLALAKTKEAKEKVGKQLDSDNALLAITTDNIEHDMADLRTKGVRLTSDLIDEPYGRFLFFEDLYGNTLYLHAES
jgi:lactoylglutathione lyase